MKKTYIVKFWDRSNEEFYSELRHMSSISHEQLVKNIERIKKERNYVGWKIEDNWAGQHSERLERYFGHTISICTVEGDTIKGKVGYITVNGEDKQYNTVKFGNEDIPLWRISHLWY